MLKTAAVIAGLLWAFWSGVSLAAQGPQPVVVTNSPSAPVPVSGTLGVSGTITVGNTQASPLFVTPTAGATSLAGSGSFTFAAPGTIATPMLAVDKCSQIRLGVSTQNLGDTVEVTVFNDLNLQLDQFIVGAALGGNTINTTRVYDTPGIGVYMWLTPQNLPTGIPVTWGVYCRG